MTFFGCHTIIWKYLDLKDLKKNGGISGSGTIKIDFKT